MESGSFYPTPPSDLHDLPDDSPPSPSRDVARSQQQEWGPILVPHATWYYVDGQGVPRVIWMGPLWIHSSHMVLPEHFQRGLTGSSALLGALGTSDPPGSAQHVGYLPAGAENAEMFMALNAPPLPHGQAHSHHQAPPFNPPSHDNRAPSSYDVVQAGVPTRIAEHGHAIPDNVGSLGAEPGYGDVTLSNVALPPGHVHTERSPVAPPIAPNIAYEAATNLETISPLYRTAPRPGGVENREGMVGSYQASGERAPLSPSNKPRYQEKPCTVGAPTIPVPWRSHAGFPNTAAFFGHQDGVQSTGHYNDLPHSSLPHTASVPAQTIPPVISDRVNPPTYPAASQGHLRPVSDVSAVATGSSVITPTRANFPPRSTTSTAQESPRAVPQPSGDLRPCMWRNNQGGICGEWLGWNCQKHLASVHGIVKISDRKRIECGACGERQQRKYILRHFREKHLGFRRSKRNAA